MLNEAIGDVLPSAVGVALSPVPIIAVVLVLATPRARSNGPAFAVGWVAGLVIVSAIVLVVAGGADSSSATDDGIDWMKTAFGVVFLVMAARQWRRRPKEGVEPETPKWMSSIDGFTAPGSLGLGALLSAANPKNLALTLAAAGSIAQAGLDARQSTLAVAVFVVIASITVLGPVAFYLVTPATAGGPLAAVKDVMSRHDAVIVMVVLLVLGAKLIGNGIAGAG